MIHLTKVMSSEYPKFKLVTPTMVDVNFNIVETLIDDITIYEYETYRFENLEEYIQYQMEENNKQLSDDNIAIMMGVVDNNLTTISTNEDTLAIMMALADLNKKIDEINIKIGVNV